MPGSDTSNASSFTHVVSNSDDRKGVVGLRRRSKSDMEDGDRNRHVRHTARKPWYRFHVGENSSTAVQQLNSTTSKLSQGTDGKSSTHTELTQECNDPGTHSRDNHMDGSTFSGSLLDQSDVSGEISDSDRESVASAAGEGITIPTHYPSNPSTRPPKAQSSDPADAKPAEGLRGIAELDIKRNSPPPGCAESSSNSSSSSKESSSRNRRGEAKSIFRGRGHGALRESRRVISQDSGIVSVTSPSDTFSLPVEVVPVNESETERGPNVPFTPLQRIPYVHGSYSTAAPMMLHDTKWMRILRHLMPESHADALTILCQERKAGTSNFPDAVRIMKWAENNPVVAAYGILNSDAGRGVNGSEQVQTERNFAVAIGGSFNTQVGDRRPSQRLSKRWGSATSRDAANMTRHPMLEWDVFLDPNLVRKVDSALQAVDDIQDTNADEVAQIAADVEVDRQIGRLISRMVLAHGSTSQLVAEAVGFTPRHNFASVVEQGESQRLHRRRRKPRREETLKKSGLIDVFKAERHRSCPPPGHDIVAPVAPGKGRAKGAGIFVERWMAIFAAALQLAQDGGRMDHSSSLIEHSRLVESLDDDAEIRQVKPTMCGVFLCLGLEDPNSTRADHSKTSMAKSCKEIHRILGSPLHVVLDLKSRRVHPRIWARLVSTLRSRGVEVGGLGSFDIEELRSIQSFCSSPVTGVIFFHSAGDLQRACHANEVKRGDTVYFNAGSLITPKPNIVAKLNCCQSDHYVSDAHVSREVVFQPYAYPRAKVPSFLAALECKSTLQDYQRRFDLKIGVYVQEFSICDRTLDAIARFVNENSTIYNLGLAYGGINGKTSPGVLGDGYWNQRYMGRSWDLNAQPTDAMHLLHIEDHRLVKKAFGAGAWGHIGMVNPVDDVGGDATGDGADLNVCRPTE